VWTVKCSEYLSKTYFCRPYVTARSSDSTAIAFPCMFQKFYIIGPSNKLRVFVRHQVQTPVKPKPSLKLSKLALLLFNHTHFLRHHRILAMFLKASTRRVLRIGHPTFRV
jgi:hypothetical protein